MTPSPTLGGWSSIISLVRDQKEHYQGVGDQTCAAQSDKKREDVKIIPLAVGGDGWYC
jgi:hypothetical protein